LETIFPRPPVSPVSLYLPPAGRFSGFGGVLLIVFFRSIVLGHLQSRLPSALCAHCSGSRTHYFDYASCGSATATRSPLLVYIMLAEIHLPNGPSSFFDPFAGRLPPDYRSLRSGVGLPQVILAMVRFEPVSVLFDSGASVVALIPLPLG